MKTTSKKRGAIGFKGSRRYPMQSLAPTAPAVARLARRWAEWRSDNVAEVQEELPKKARRHVQYMSVEQHSNDSVAGPRPGLGRQSGHRHCRGGPTLGARAHILEVLGLQRWGRRGQETRVGCCSRGRDAARSVGAVARLHPCPFHAQASRWRFHHGPLRARRLVAKHRCLRAPKWQRQ